MSGRGNGAPMSGRGNDDLRAAQQALAEVNERQKQVLQSITDGFVVLDSQWRFTFVNRKAEEILRPLGQSEATLLGKSHWDAFPETRGTELEREYRRAVKEGVAVTLEHYYAPLKSWFDIRAFPSATGLTVVFQDITRRKEAEQLLEAERLILARIASEATLGEALLSLAREIERRSSDGMRCSVLLLDADGERLRHGAAPSLPEAYNAAIDGVRIGPGVGSCGTAAAERSRVWVTDIANHPYWADYRELAASHGLGACCSEPILSSRGEVLGTIAMYYPRPHDPSDLDRRLIELARDMAAIAIERERSQAALRSSEERLRASFEQAGVGIASATAEGRFTEMNRKFCELLGYPPEELRKLSFREITHPEDLAPTLERFQRLLSGEQRDYHLEKRYVRRDGSVFWSHTTVTRISDAAGATLRFVGVIEDITARKATEEALRRSEELSRGIIESSQDCIKLLDLDGTLQWISESGCRALCIEDPSTVLGRGYAGFWSGEDRGRAEAAIAAAVRGESGSFTGHFPVQGVPRWWNVLITPMRNSAGSVERLLAVSRDVTDRVQSERQVRDSEGQLRLLANSIPQLAWMAEPDGHIFWYNERWYEYTGTTLEQMQGWGWRSVHDPALLPQVEARWRKSIETGEPFEMEFPLRSARGEMRWFLTRVQPMRDPGGRVVRWFGTNTDIEDVRRIRVALEDERRMLERLNETGAALASNLDLQEVLQTVTDSATALSGAKFGAFFYNVVDAKGEAYQLYTLSGAPRAAFERFGMPRATPVFAPTFRGEGVVRSDDVREDPRYGQMGPHHGMPKGHLPVRSYLAVPVISRSGEVIGGLFFGHPQPAVFTERTERLVSGIAAQAAIAIDNARLYQAAQQATQERERLLESERAARTEAERASRMKDDFLATLSHELRTPLSAILGWAHLMRARPPGAEELAKGLEVVERNARLQTQLVEDLLDMSRITSGKLRLDVQPVLPASFIEAALETVRPAAAAKDIALQAVLDPQAGPVAGDGARLQQVVWNLLNNAIKFTPKGGKVRVLLQRVNSHVEISVVDNGAGIEPQFLHHVFERFRQADASTTRRHGGLGIGLSLVRHLAELHGGSVRAESAGPGQGSTFVVSLPLIAVHRGRESATRAHPRAPAPEAALPDFARVDLSGLQVLVVDDQPDACELVARVLGECGARVTTAHDAGRALELLRAAPPDVIVSDIGMPDVDGYELLRRVRALENPGGSRIPAIAMTAFARSEDRTRALHAGFQVHIAKPVEPAELIATVASVAGRVSA